MLANKGATQDYNGVKLDKSLSTRISFLFLLSSGFFSAPGIQREKRTSEMACEKEEDRETL